MDVYKQAPWVTALSMIVILGGCDDGASGYQGGDSNNMGGYVVGTGGTALIGSGGGGGQPAPTGMPCDVKQIVDAKCGLCHGATPISGAPFPLVSQADFQSVAPDGAAVHASAKSRINGNGNLMPPPNQPQLTPEELATLDAWLGQGAPYSGESCGGGGGTGGMVGTGGLMGTGGTQPPGEVTCYEFRAFADANSLGQPYNVTTGEGYYNFVFKRPWQGAPQAVSIRHLVDNTPVVHHTLVYQSSGDQSPGVTPSIGTHGDDMLLAGWVPGGSDTILPDDVGLATREGDFVFEIHYFNSTGGVQQDSTGFEICVADTPRPNTAGIHWLGDESKLFGAQATEWVGTCTPDYSSGPITVLTSWPHMHLEGRHLKTIINRGGNPSNGETLVDEPFDFDFQVSYPTPTVLMPGDTLTTTCTFSRPTYFGTSTTEEMCFNFVVAYPNGSLSSGSGGGLTSGLNHCLQ